ncbi:MULTISPECIES: hypothetical protein [unclassified Streptomyces]|nr:MULTISPECIES: hypothetical protein [unclassified Streptomyces]
MISQWGRCQAASRAAACARAAVSEKFPEATTPTPCSSASAAISS